jgi:hypothetical protein
MDRVIVLVTTLLESQMSPVPLEYARDSLYLHAVFRGFVSEPLLQLRAYTPL